MGGTKVCSESKTNRDSNCFIVHAEPTRGYGPCVEPVPNIIIIIIIAILLYPYNSKLEVSRKRLYMDYIYPGILDVCYITYM